MGKYKIALVNSPNPDNGGECGNYAVFPAMAPVHLGSHLKKEFGSSIDVKVIDGNFENKEAIIRQLREYNPDLVGLSVLTPTYKEGLDIAKEAKNSGAVTVLGAEHACYFPNKILTNREFIDYVVQAEGGEEPLAWIVKKETGSLENKQKNMMYRRKADGKKTDSEKVYGRTSSGIEVVASFPRFKIKEFYKSEEDIPDLGLIKDYLAIVSKNYNARYGRFHDEEKRPVTINNVRGCANGNEKKRCAYCSIWDLRLNKGNIDFFWKVVKEYYEKQGINFFFEVGDSFLSFLRYAEQLAIKKPFDPKTRGIEFEIYARADDINEKSIKILNELNVTRVNLGVDSGNDFMLEVLRKHMKLKQGLSPSEMNYQAIKALSEAGKTVHISFPLGQLGESKESLENTLLFIERVAKEFPNSIATLEASELIPLPHSPIWDILTYSQKPMFYFEEGIEGLLRRANIKVSGNKRRELRDKYVGKDLLDIIELSKDWIKYFTHVDWDLIQEMKEKVSKIAEEVGASYGRAI